MQHLKDIQNIVNNHYIAGGKAIEKGYIKQAEQLFSEGLKKLKSLNLPSTDYLLLIKAFKSAVRATQLAGKERYKKGIKLLLKSAKYVRQYNDTVIARVINGND